jgi:SAM-dependent methyltransferase
VKLAEIDQLEQEWKDIHPEHRQQEGRWGWEPFPVDRFLPLLVIAAARNHGPFLDVGCGIGTKLLIAESRGLKAEGIEIVPDYVDEARRLGVNASVADAVTFTRYGEFGIVFINHPLKDFDAEDSLELMIQDQMSPGAVLITVNNIRVRPDHWKIVAAPISPKPGTVRFDWVAVKPQQEEK